MIVAVVIAIYAILLKINPAPPPPPQKKTPGFKMASVLALQCSNQLSYEDPYRGSRLIC